jgi:hypothetical protein
VRRGTNAATYEGVYNAAGAYKFEDCSRFEVAVASAFNDQLFHKDPEGDEDKIKRRMARKFKLNPDVVMAI